LFLAWNHGDESRNSKQTTEVRKWLGRI